jgi:hypothetical protein
MTRGFASFEAAFKKAISCATGKTPYASEASALVALSYLREKSARHPGRDFPVRAYQCACGWWHLTSKKA